MPRIGSWSALLLMGVYAMQAHGQDRQAALDIKIDVSHSVGEIRALQDVGGGPLCQRGAVDLTPYYKALGLRNIRLHDVPWTYDNVLDTNYVFPHWDASPDDPKSYDFTLSDYYLGTIIPLVQDRGAPQQPADFESEVRRHFRGYRAALQRRLGKRPQVGDQVLGDMERARRIRVLEGHA
jgi:hypothetical protein